MLQLGRRGKGNRIPNVVAAGTGATPAAFYLGLCRLRGILSRLRPPRSFCRRAVLPCSYDGATGGLFLAAAAMTLHRFSSLGLKSRIDAAFGLFLRVSLHRFASLSLKSRIDARKRLFSGKSLHRFPSLGLKSRINARKRGLPRVLPELAESLHRKKKSPSLV